MVLTGKKNKYLVSGMLFITFDRHARTIKTKKTKKVTYDSIKMDNFSTIVGIGYLEICVTQILINIFKFLGTVYCDECLQKALSRN